MKFIPVTQGKVAIVDNQDYAALSKYFWHLNTGYAMRWLPRKNGKQIHVLMHRVIMKPPQGVEVDHINQDRLDNRRSNLRLCGRPQNMMNRGLNSNNTTGFRGVFKARRLGYFIARIIVNKQRHYLGTFHSALAAYSAYKKEAKAHHGVFAKGL